MTSHTLAARPSVSAGAGAKSVLKVHPGQVAFSIVLALVAAATSLLNPLVVRDLVAALGNGSSLVLPLILLAVLVLGGAACSAWSSFLLGRVGEQGIRRLRTGIAAHILRLPLTTIRTAGTGELVARVTNDAAQLRSVIDVGVTTLPVSVVVVAVSLVVMGLLDWVLLLIVIGTFVVAGVAIAVFVRGVRRGATGQQVAVGRLAATLTSALGSVSTIKAYRAEDRATDAVDADAGAAALASISADRSQACISPFMGLGQQIAIIGVIAGSGARLASGALSAPNFVAFLMYLFQLIAPLTVLASGVARVQVGLSALGRIRQVLSLPREDAGAASDPATLRSLHPAPVLSLRGVDAAYDDQQVLDGVDLDVAARGMTALVGPSGAGKTTVLALAERFVEPTAGSVLLHGHDVTAWPLGSVRRRIALVDQQCTLLEDTVRANLCLGRERRADDGEVWAALDDVGMRAVVEQLPLGLDTVVGGAVDLSGGQRQRLALARALLSDADLLLLDEPTSQLDGLNERRLVGVLERLARERAVLVVAHRLSTVRDADHIVVLDAGRAVGAGDHTSLLASCPAYTALVEGQADRGAGGAHRLRVTG
ncbi:ABC transporter ATP-binding protein [Jatrophihabitans sp. YIM 134969]